MIFVVVDFVLFTMDAENFLDFGWNNKIELHVYDDDDNNMMVL